VGRIWRNPKAAAVLLAVAALVVLVGLFVKKYQDTGPDSAGGHDPGAFSAPSDSAGAIDGPADHFFPEPGAPLPRKTLTPVEPNGLVLGHLPTHALVLTVTSAGRIPRVGYIVPTSPDSSYGDIKNPGRQWSLTTTVVGRPAYAAVFIQAGATGTAITCRVSVDGVSTDVKTTHGSYGRAVCLG
jgi:hypothetical protein